MLWLSLLFFSCNNNSTDKALVQNLAKGLAGCHEDQINVLVQSHNIQTAFDYCGENQFNSFRWSFDGTQLFFGYYGKSYILDGEKRYISPVNLPDISSTKPAWLESGFVAVPLKLEKNAKTQNIAWYKPDGSNEQLSLTLTDIQDLQNYDKETILFSAKNSAKVRKAYTLKYGEADPKEIFPFIKDSFDSFGYAPQTKVLGIVTGKKAKVYREEQLLFQADNVSRIIPHSFADFVAFESEGKPISVLKPIDTVGKTEAEIEREKRKRKQVEQNLPDYMDKTYKPNEIHIVDLKTNNRYRIPFFFGKDFEWYTENGYYCSMTLEGVDGESIHPNVGLLTLRHPLGSIRANKLDRAELLGTLTP